MAGVTSPPPASRAARPSGRPTALAVTRTTSDSARYLCPGGSGPSSTSPAVTAPSISTRPVTASTLTPAGSGSPASVSVPPSESPK